MIKTLGSRIKALTTGSALLNKTFIWAPFMAGMAIFAVVLPKPKKVIAALKR